ncbi:MAG TPA: hypothetical protein VGR07_02775, partial [Thermoanaerobaculia bacterium]|nr:hypothetical protein [Thermoanaerobaculia bacterium]
MSPFRGAVAVHLALAAALSCTAASDHRAPTPPPRAAVAAKSTASAAPTAPEPAGPPPAESRGQSRGTIPLSVRET